MSVAINGTGSITGIDQGFNITSGSVGIGTDNPTAPLQINHASPKIILRDNDNDADISVASIGGAAVYSAASDIIFQTSNSSEKLRITSGGKVGIRTDNPKQIFSVVGRANFDLQGDYYGSWINGDSQGSSSFNVGAWHNAGGRMRNEGSHLVLETMNTSHWIQLQPSGGNVSVGSNNANGLLALTAASGRLLTLRNSTTGSGSGDGSYLALNGSDLQIANAESANVILYTADTERLRITSEGEMYLTGGSTNGSLHFWEGAGVSGNSDTARLGVGKDNNTLIYSNAASPARSNFAIGTSGNIPLILSTSNTTRLRITSGGITEFLGSAIKMPVGTSDPGSAATGWAYYNSSNAQLRIYDGSTWGGVAFSTKGTQTNPATSSSDLSASGALAQYYFAPDGGTAFQNYACGGLSNLGTIPSGGPSWVSTHSSLVMIVKGQVGQTSQYVMSQGNYLKFISESISRTTNTPYIYWAVFDSGTLWGITRTRWTGATYSTWGSNHDWDTGEANPPSGTAVWDVWKTGSGTTGNTLSTGSYTVSNDNNLVRAVLPQQSHNNAGTAYGIHYKRTTSGEHYPWFNSSGNVTSNGYFLPSGTYNLGSDTRYVHYIYLADS